jgi:outer membrane lipopolysaccharide assembly protein LptE/RlpB
VKHLELQDYSFDQNQLLGKSKEAEFIMDSLATRISRAVLTRLGNI